LALFELGRDSRRRKEEDRRVELSAEKEKKIRLRQQMGTDNSRLG